jgi:OH-DDVA oxygenase/3-O-methylgallate 3,4-dioxygenase
MPPQQWRSYGDRSRNQKEHWFNGKTYGFEELVDVRAENHFDQELTEDKFAARYEACQTAIRHLKDTVSRIKPDVAIIMGDDQHEAFLDDNMPCISIFNGASIDDLPAGGIPGFRDPIIDNQPKERTTHPAYAEFGNYLIETFMANEFDLGRTNKLPEGRHDGAVGHAFYYVYRRLMDNKVIPNIPVMVNTYFPPNVPSAMRCYNFGKTLRKAIEDWDEDKTVAIFASGGLSHTVIEEELDQAIIKGLMNDDVKQLTDWPDVRFRAGTSEIKNWIALAGAMSGTSLAPNMIDYVPCYRTEAGNGCAMGMAEWV